MRLEAIDFGSLLSYSPHGVGAKDRASKQTMYAIKGDRMNGNIHMSEYIARDMSNRLDRLPFAEFFTGRPTLVPAPKSSLTRPGSLWVPQRLARYMQEYGLGVQAEYLERRRMVEKSSTSAPGERPKPQDHYESMEVRDTLSDHPDEIVIVDDVITRGATLIGAAGKLAEAFPSARIRCFAALRTVSKPGKFKDIFDPCAGQIVTKDGDAFATCSG